MTTHDSDYVLRQRWHPDGFPLYDVYVDGVLVGLVRQHAVEAPNWFAYDRHGDEPLLRAGLRREAVRGLLERRQ